MLGGLFPVEREKLNLSKWLDLNFGAKGEQNLVVKPLPH